MSVGVQRLRDEPDVIRKGALDKGEDVTLVDVALALDARRRALLGEADTRKAERNLASRQIGEAIKGGAAPGGPEVAALRAASVAAHGPAAVYCNCGGDSFDFDGVLGFLASKGKVSVQNGTVSLGVAPACQH